MLKGVKGSEPITCFKSDTQILTNTGYQSIQNLRPRDLIQTLHL